MKIPDQDVLKIDKDVPMVEVIRVGKWNVILKSMERGDSFHVESNKRAAISNAVTHIGKSFPKMKFTLRKFNGAYRCWRIK